MWHYGWGAGEVHTGFGVGEPEGNRDHFEDHSVEWSIILKMDLQEFGWGGMDWIDLAQDTNRWRALVNDVMNLRVQ
jgi:hypothetical protein